MMSESQNQNSTNPNLSSGKKRSKLLVLKDKKKKQMWVQRVPSSHTTSSPQLLESSVLLRRSVVNVKNKVISRVNQENNSDKSLIFSTQAEGGEFSDSEICQPQ